MKEKKYIWDADLGTLKNRQKEPHLDTIHKYIEQDGIDISDFVLTDYNCGYWTFSDIFMKDRGFLLYYDPEEIIHPIPKYLITDPDISISYSFSASCIGEAYVKHNRISVNAHDLVVLLLSYQKTEEARIKNAIEIAQACGYEKASRITGLTVKCIKRYTSEQHTPVVLPAETPGSLLKKEREKNGYTQQQLADLLHLSREAVSKYEKDVNQLPLSVMKDVSNICNTDVFHNLLAGRIGSKLNNLRILRNECDMRAVMFDEKCIYGSIA